MERKQGGLIPIGKALSGLGGPVKELREATPQALNHFTRFDQVNQLVMASEADPDLGFMVRMMALFSLPRTNPGNQHQYKRVNGPFKLIMSVSGDHKLPFGNLPRPTSCGYLSQMDTPLHPVSWLTPSRPNTVVPPASRFRDRPVPNDRIPNNRVIASAWESDPDRRS